MSNVCSHCCDFFQTSYANDGSPIFLCFHPERKDSFCFRETACELAEFKKIFGEPAKAKPCFECDHFCQSQVFDERRVGDFCANHEISRLCPVKIRCKAKILSKTDTIYGWCKLHNRSAIWFETCPDHRKEGEKLV